MTENYYKNKESVKEYIRLAKDVNGGAIIEKLKPFLPAKSKILEIGSGPGTDWNILNKDYNVTGSDNSKEFLAHLISSNPNGSFKELDAITLKTDEKFDGIYSNKVMHHLSDADLLNSISRQHKILKGGGMICHSFWKGEGSEYFKGLFVNYHTETTLRTFFEKHFNIVLIEEYAEFEEGDSLFLIGNKN